MNTNRVSAGKSEGGQFAPKTHSEADFDLPSDDSSVDANVDSPIRYDATAEEIREMVSSPDHHLRAELPGFKNVPDDVLARLQEQDQELSTRQSVVATMYPGVAKRAARDSHPLIRAHALYAGWDLEEEDRAALEKDTGVQRVLELLKR